MRSRASTDNSREPARRPILHLPRKPVPTRNPDALDFGEARKALIRKTAYSRAARYGRRPQIDDWIAAEAEIDARLSE
jgi:hypothetical protein